MNFYKDFYETCNIKLLNVPFKVAVCNFTVESVNIPNKK